MLRVVLVALALAAVGGAAWLTLLRPPQEPPPVEAEAPPPREEVEVLVAAADVARGGVIADAVLVWETRLAEAATPAMILRGAEPEARTALVGRRARIAIAAGAPVVRADLLEHAGGLLAATLSAGERALAVRVSAESAAGGFILPGDRVDVLLTVPAASDGRPRVETVLSNVEVLAIDQTDVEASDVADAQVGKTATLRLSEPQARRLAEAMATGHLSLALRSPTDLATAPRPPELDPSASDAPPEPAEAGAATVVLRRAGAAETVSLP